MSYPVREYKHKLTEENMNKAKKMLLIVLLCIGAVLFLTLAFSHSLTIQKYTEKTDKVTGNVKIVVLSDLHDTYYGDKQEEIIEAINREKPDILLFTGDILDDVKQTGAAMTLFELVGREYPCYYVSGNHEVWSGKIDDMKNAIRECGVTVLEGTSDVVMVDNQHIRICGIDDPEVGDKEWLEQLTRCQSYLGDNVYTLLMTHRPEEVMRYHGYDLVVSGHTHGGIARIPKLLNGFYAPNQGFFPEYAGGKYDVGEITMIVSRGLSKYGAPRIFNPPEMVVLNIESENKGF